MKKKIFLLPCIAAVAIATFVGAKSFQTNAYESNDLLMQNVEALSKNTGGDEGFNCFLAKDDCVVRRGSYADFRLFVAKFKYSGSMSVGYGECLDLTEFTALYTPAVWWQVWRDKVRCGEDVRCIDLVREFGFFK